MSDIANIYQISYSHETRKILDPGFKVIGDETNPRPEWFEYWHIRKFFLSEILDQNKFYGFLSPKFCEKTRLKSAEIYRFIRENSAADVIMFSPYLDQSALFLNIVEQGWFAHPELKTIFDHICKRYFGNIDHEILVTTSENTVFCNFFVAKPDFWARWFEICEDIFLRTEEGSSDFGKEIAGVTRYKTTSAPIRTFVIERIATLIMSTESKWKKANYPSFDCAVGKMSVAKSTSTLLALDSLKRVYVETRSPEYLLGYFNLRHTLLKGTTLAELEHSPNSPCGAVFTYTQYLLKKLNLGFMIS